MDDDQIEELSLNEIALLSGSLHKFRENKRKARFFGTSVPNGDYMFKPYASFDPPGSGLARPLSDHFRNVRSYHIATSLAAVPPGAWIDVGTWNYTSTEHQSIEDLRCRVRFAGIHIWPAVAGVAENFHFRVMGSQRHLDGSVDSYWWIPDTTFEILRRVFNNGKDSCYFAGSDSTPMRIYYDSTNVMFVIELIDIPFYDNVQIEVKGVGNNMDLEALVWIEEEL